MKILMVLTSHDRLGETNEKTGFWLEEFATPYYVFRDNGFDVTLASPAGGQPPVDPKSEAEDAQTEATRRLSQDEEAKGLLADTRPLASINPEEYDGIFYPGGHGPLWDLSEDIDSIALLEAFNRRSKPIACVCHGPAALLRAKGEDGLPLVRGKRVTGFSNSEESLVQLTEVVPFMIEDMLKNNGGTYSQGEDWGEHVEVGANLITGQNPASSRAAAEEMVKLLQK